MEMARVRRPEGRFPVTSPFIYQQQNGVRQASTVKDDVLYHCEPIYRGNSERYIVGSHLGNQLRPRGIFVLHSMNEVLNCA
jgi:hypothetical protein